MIGSTQDASHSGLNLDQFIFRTSARSLALLRVDVDQIIRGHIKIPGKKD